MIKVFKSVFPRSMVQASGPVKIFDAHFLSSLMDDSILDSTDEAMVGKGIEFSIADKAVHLPVPFCPALSKIMSIKSLDDSTSL